MKEESKSRVAVGVQEGVVRSRSRPAGILTVDAGGAAAEAKNQDDLGWNEPFQESSGKYSDRGRSRCFGGEESG